MLEDHFRAGTDQSLTYCKFKYCHVCGKVYDILRVNMFRCNGLVSEQASVRPLRDSTSKYGPNVHCHAVNVFVFLAAV